MNDDLRKEALRKAAIKANHGKRVVTPSVAPIYPAAIEREYRKLAAEYIGCVKTVFLKHFGKVKAASKARTDDVNDRDFIAIIRMAFDDMEVELTNVLNKFGLKRRLIRIAQRLDDHSAEEFARMLQAVSIDITKDMFMGDFFRYELERWIEENITLISTLPHKTLSAMRQICLEGYREGKSISTITKEIQDTYTSVGKKHARMIARDQTGKLAAKVNQSRQEAAGVKEYIWVCNIDGRERDCHRALNGKRCRWDTPEPQWYYKKGKVKVYTGKAHPGEYFQCRCRAKPIIDLSVLDL